MAATFGSVTMSVLFKSVWSVVLSSAQMMEPYYQLGESGNYRAADLSITRQYLSGETDFSDLDPRNRRWSILLTTMIGLALDLQASVASEAMTVQAGATCNTGGATRLCDPIWTINSAVLRGLQVTLLLVGISIILLIWQNWRRQSHISTYPCSLDAMASMLGNSDPNMINTLRQIDPNADDETVAKFLEGKYLSLKQIETERGEPAVGISMYIRTTAEEFDQQQHRNLSQRTQPTSWVLNVRRHVDTIRNSSTALCNWALFGVLLAFAVTGNDSYEVNVLGPLSGNKTNSWKFMNGTRFGPRMLMTYLVSTMLIPFWEDMELKARIMTPYRRLQKSKGSGKHLLTMRLHGTAFVSFFHAVWHGNWFQAFMAALAVSGYLLLIMIAGVPYNYGQMANISFWSTVASVAILFFMGAGMLALVFWHRSNPKMPREPTTLVNTWLLLCGSRLLEEFRNKSLKESRQEMKQAKGEYWFRKGMGVDGVERWMVEADHPYQG